MTSAAFSADPATLADERQILSAALAILDQGAGLLRALAPEDYARRVPAVFNATIGGHYRHCLDHFASLTRALDAVEVDYDHRERDPRIEGELDFALGITCELRESLARVAPETLRQPIEARCEVSYGHGHSPAIGSTLGRELVYCIAHAIHHYALIAVMARLLNVPLPPHFGVAPSTVTHLNHACS